MQLVKFQEKGTRGLSACEIHTQVLCGHRSQLIKQEAGYVYNCKIWLSYVCASMHARAHAFMQPGANQETTAREICLMRASIYV